jgi:AcrR family transcriptional regulator
MIQTVEESPAAIETSPEAPTTRRREILEVAARLICARGYEGASMQQIADACGLTKAGLYHHVESKEHLLVEIMHYGMDLFDEKVLSQVETIADPLERLRTCMEKNVLLVTRDRNKEITIILHEHATLTGGELARINARKKRYVRFLERSFAEAVAAGEIRPVDPKVAAFTFLGAVNWIYKWFRADGQVPEKELVRGMQDIFFGGLEAAPAAESAGGSTPKATAAP